MYKLFLTIDHLKIVYMTPISFVMGCILLGVLYRAHKHIKFKDTTFDVGVCGYLYIILYSKCKE